MSTNKHDTIGDIATGFTDDLERNPGIGESAGTTASGIDPEFAEADSTVEGDVENETNSDGSVSPDHLGRTNR